MVATVGTWAIDPEFPVETRTDRIVRVTDPSSGAVQRGDTQKSVGVDSGEPYVRTHVLKFGLATKTERDAYLALWETAGRGSLAISFTPPGGAAIPVRFRNAPKITRTSPTRYSFTVTLEEVPNA